MMLNKYPSMNKLMNYILKTINLVHLKCTSYSTMMCKINAINMGTVLPQLELYQYLIECILIFHFFLNHINKSTSLDSSCAYKAFQQYRL